MGARDAIADSNQGRSFRAFWDFLMSTRRQEELTQLLERVLSLEPIEKLKPDARTRRVHYDWLEAAASRPSAPSPSCRSSSGAFWTTRPGWKTAASCKSCAE